MKRILSLCVALLTAICLCAGNVITYTATEKLPETKDRYSSGLHTNAFGDASISSHTFSNRTGTITFNKDITVIGFNAFYNCSSLISLTIPNSVTTIGSSAFYKCHSLYRVDIPNSVTSIESSAFSRCGMSGNNIDLHDNISFIGLEAFDNTTHIYVNKGSLTCLALWESLAKSYPCYYIYDKEDDTRLLSPEIKISGITQTCMTAKVSESTDYIMSLSKDQMLSTQNFSGLYPETEETVYLYAKKGDSEWYIINKTSAKTKSLNLKIKSTKVTSSSISYKAEYDEGDANVVVSMNLAGKKSEKLEGEITGLDPQQTYNVTMAATVTNGNGTKTYTSTANIQTSALELKTMQPKVINVGNVIVAAEANLDEEETNVGFEWRRTDWTSDFASNTGGAYMYNGQMEGYIRNLNAEKLWKYRPYYLSDSGKYYYGDWVGLDPSNTSYFEATVHTYDKIEVEGNTALVKGYALRGTDPIKVQGFVYWKKVAGAKAMDGRMYAAAVPSNAKTVEASGQIMNATLANLDYDSEYAYVAFVTTTEGETFYGEERTFKTEADTSGISDLMSDNASSEPATVMGYYDLNGRRIQNPERGIYIIRYSDGSSRKFMKK